MNTPLFDAVDDCDWCGDFRGLLLDEAGDYRCRTCLKGRTLEDAAARIAGALALDLSKEARGEIDRLVKLVEVAEKKAQRTAAEKAAPDLLAACEAVLPWVAVATANESLSTENAKADLLALQLAITKAGGNAGRGIDEAARAILARAEGRQP